MSLSAKLKIPTLVQPEVMPPIGMEGLHTNKIHYIKKHFLHKLQKHKFAIPFMEPVDAKALNVPTYYSIIQNPMDLGTIIQRVANRYYHSVDYLINDLKLVISNCYTFNRPDAVVYRNGKKMEKLLFKVLDKLPKGEELPYIKDNTEMSQTKHQCRSKLKQLLDTTEQIDQDARDFFHSKWMVLSVKLHKCRFKNVEDFDIRVENILRKCHMQAKHILELFECDSNQQLNDEENEISLKNENVINVFGSALWPCHKPHLKWQDSVISALDKTLDCLKQDLGKCQDDWKYEIKEEMVETVLAKEEEMGIRVMQDVVMTELVEEMEGVEQEREEQEDEEQEGEENKSKETREEEEKAEVLEMEINMVIEQEGEEREAEEEEVEKDEEKKEQEETDNDEEEGVHGEESEANEDEEEQDMEEEGEGEEEGEEEEDNEDDEEEDEEEQEKDAEAVEQGIREVIEGVIDQNGEDQWQEATFQQEWQGEVMEAVERQDEEMEEEETQGEWQELEEWQTDETIVKETQEQVQEWQEQEEWQGGETQGEEGQEQEWQVEETQEEQKEEQEYHGQEEWNGAETQGEEKQEQEWQGAGMQGDEMKGEEVQTQDWNVEEWQEDEEEQEQQQEEEKKVVEEGQETQTYSNELLQILVRAQIISQGLCSHTNLVDSSDDEETESQSNFICVEDRHDIQEQFDGLPPESMAEIMHMTEQSENGSISNIDRKYTVMYFRPMTINLIKKAMERAGRLQIKAMKHAEKRNLKRNFETSEDSIHHNPYNKQRRDFQYANEEIMDFTVIPQQGNQNDTEEDSVGDTNESVSPQQFQSELPLEYTSCQAQVSQYPVAAVAEDFNNDENISESNDYTSSDMESVGETSKHECMFYNNCLR